MKLTNSGPFQSAFKFKHQSRDDDITDITFFDFKTGKLSFEIKKMKIFFYLKVLEKFLEKK